MKKNEGPLKVYYDNIGHIHSSHRSWKNFTDRISLVPTQQVVYTVSSNSEGHRVKLRLNQNILSEMVELVG